MSEWYYSKAGQEIGPIPGGRLKKLATAGELSPSDFIWRDGLPEWVPASQVKGLFDPPNPTGVALAPAEPAASQASAAAREGAASGVAPPQEAAAWAAPAAPALQPFTRAADPGPGSNLVRLGPAPSPATTPPAAAPPAAAVPPPLPAMPSLSSANRAGFATGPALAPPPLPAPFAAGPARKKGMPTWAWVLIGGGLACIVLFVALFALIILPALNLRGKRPTGSGALRT